MIVAIFISSKERKVTKSLYQLDMVAHAYTFSTPEAEGGGL
jgi:hypothetical protein